MKIGLKIIKLARLLRLYEETKLQDGSAISHEGTLAVGSEVFVESENGDIVPLADGEYVTEDSNKVMVEGGKVIAIVAPEAPLESVEDVKDEQPAEQPTEPTEHNEEMAEQPAEPAEQPAEPAEQPTEQMEDERDARIAELETANAELTSQLDAANARIAELEALVNEYKEKESKSVDDSVDDVFKSQNDKKVVSNIEYVRSRMK